VTCADWHPDDERLLMRYVDPLAGDGTLDRHLAGCRACTARHLALTRDLDAWHQIAAGHGDAVFDAERLALQRRGIQQRLGAMVPARVLPFPAAPAPVRHALLARAAAAVLLAALGGAGVFRVLQMPEPPRSRASVRAASGHTASPVRLIRDVAPDAVLEDIDVALMRPRTAELLALDEFTPSARDIATPPR
jgi:anti-sigma factor RsiW